MIDDQSEPGSWQRHLRRMADLGNANPIRIIEGKRARRQNTKGHLPGRPQSRSKA